MSQHLTEYEIKKVLMLVTYLNQQFGKPTDGVAADVNLVDCNGESLGLVEWNGDYESYVLNYPDDDARPVYRQPTTLLCGAEEGGIPTCGPAADCPHGGAR